MDRREEINISNVELIDTYFIKKLRKYNDDSVEKIANELGINRTYFYCIENGEKRLTEDLLNRIVSYYNVNYITF